ncbi:MAG: alkaline phosphatase family protein, partial [Verrucomicrobiia bacterium]
MLVKLFTSSVVSGFLVFWVAGGIPSVASAGTRTIRVVAYNIDSDQGQSGSQYTLPQPGLIAPSSGGSVTNGGVLEGIGEENVAGDPAQPIDILALEETTSNTATVQPIVDGLNAFYGSRNIPAGYAMSPYQATEESGDPTTGNGPNAMVYNTNTLQLVASVGIGTPQGSSNGEYRQIVRYEFAPAGAPPMANNVFYVYVSHYKADSGSPNTTYRNGEAQIIRADSATLPSNARILYVGDYNCTASTEPMYQTLTAAGANQAFDPLNPSDLYNITWGSSTLTALTESATSLSARFDYQMMTSNVLYGVTGGGLAYVPGTYHAFANNGTTPNRGNVDSGSDTALNNDLTTNVTGITAAQLYQYLTTDTDHLPIVADYIIPAPTVFVIVMENENWASISGNAAAPYINNTLLPMASHAEQYYNPPGNHPSLPNYLWLEAGTNFGITADEDPSVASQTTTNHLVTLLENANISWTSYQEDITGTVCPLTATNQYVPEHNPMVYFDDVTNTNTANSAYCIANVRPFTQLAGDLQSNVVTRYNFITPNLCDDMNGNAGCPSGSLVTQGDTWLSNNIPIIMNSQAYSNNGVIFITWDQGQGGDGPIGMIVLSPLAKAGYSNTIYYTHSSTLLTMQELFNVGPLLGDAANATDLNDLFIYGPQLAVSPASGFSSSGGAGGPFSPGSQTYTLSNTGGVAMVWSATNSTTWLTLSATNGTLAAGGSTNIIVSINANSLSVGSYSDTVVFATSNGSGSATEPVSLTISAGFGLLTVTPSSGFVSGGPPGGPVSPISQTYTLTNIGGVALDWTANNSTAWLSLSATSGTLAAGASTNVTATISAAVNSFAPGGYSDTIGFTNTPSGAGNTTRAVNLNIGVGSFGFYSDFSTFASGDLAGQQGWTQVGGVSSSPVLISGGQAGFTGGLTANNQTL